MRSFRGLLIGVAGVMLTGCMTGHDERPEPDRGDDGGPGPRMALTREQAEDLADELNEWKFLTDVSSYKLIYNRPAIGFSGTGNHLETLELSDMGVVPPADPGVLERFAIEIGEDRYLLGELTPQILRNYAEPEISRDERRDGSEYLVAGVRLTTENAGTRIYFESPRGEQWQLTWVVLRGSLLDAGEVPSLRLWDTTLNMPLDPDISAVEVLRRYGRPHDYHQSAVRFDF